MNDDIKETNATPDAVPVVLMARKSCRRCYGRGYIGKTADGRLSPCSCLRMQHAVIKEGPEK